MPSNELHPGSLAPSRLRKLSFQSGDWPDGRAGTRRNGAQKLLGVLITIGEAVAYVVSGMYGDVRELGAGNAILIIVQVRLRVLHGVRQGFYRGTHGLHPRWRCLTVCPSVIYGLGAPTMQTRVWLISSLPAPAAISTATRHQASCSRVVDTHVAAGYKVVICF